MRRQHFVVAVLIAFVAAAATATIFVVPSDAELVSRADEYPLGLRPSKRGDDRNYPRDDRRP